MERIGGSLYRWVDGRGVVHYSETLPQEQEFDTAELNKQGRVLRQLDLQQTPEERRTAIEKAERERQEREQNFSQKRRDQALLDTYTEEREIDESRDRNIAIPAQAIKGLEIRLEKSRQSLDALMKQADHYTKAPRPEGLDEDIQDQKKDIARIEYDIKRYQEQTAAIREKYGEDKRRFRELKVPQTPSAPKS